jgi:hypothetical protein
MPIPKKGETEKDFVGRCVPIVMSEGKTQEQALGQCYGMYRGSMKTVCIKKDDRPPKKWFDETVAALRQRGGVDDPEALANWIWHDHGKAEKAKTVGGFESPEPGDIPKDEADILASTYASCRKDGGDKMKCAKIAWGAVKRHRTKKSLLGMDRRIAMIAKSLTGICKALGFGALASDNDSLKAGAQVEMEHRPTYNWMDAYVRKHGIMPPLDKMAESIARDHLSERADYYDRLKEIEG